MAVNQELYVDGIGVARGYGDDQRLIDAMDLLLGPAIKGMKVAIHGSKTISIDGRTPQFSRRIRSQKNPKLNLG